MKDNAYMAMDKHKPFGTILGERSTGRPRCSIIFRKRSSGSEL